MRGIIVAIEEGWNGCDVEGCSGSAVVVDWDNGSSSWECSNALKYLALDASGCYIVKQKAVDYVTGEQSAPAAVAQEAAK